MKIQSVKSSNIKRVGHDPLTMDLCVEFMDGSVYLYEDVPVVAFNDFVGAESVGSHLAKVIKPTYRARKLTPAEVVTIFTEITPTEVLEEIDRIFQLNVPVDPARMFKKTECTFKQVAALVLKK